VLVSSKPGGPVIEQTTTAVPHSSVMKNADLSTALRTDEWETTNLNPKVFSDH
jgi:hypothetical protein